MTVSPPRSGYTLPVFACAAAIAALRKLSEPPPSNQTPTNQTPANQTRIKTVPVDLMDPHEIVQIPVEQVARISSRSALAIARSDPGDNLDLTRHTPLWAYVEWADADQPCAIVIQGGEGLGRRLNPETQCSEAAIYDYAQRLLLKNLTAELLASESQGPNGEQQICVTLILPEGQELAQRTSNAAFGVVEGLSLLGTTGISQPLSAPRQLEQFQEILANRAQQHSELVFCLGENGLDIARNLGIPEPQLIKTANWLGPMLVSAAQAGVTSLLLLGYHGKLLKLAGGIFHTHHHLADGRQEILTAIAASLGLPQADLQYLLAVETIEAGLQYLRQVEQRQEQPWIKPIYAEITRRIEARSLQYIHTHYPLNPDELNLDVGCLLFNRQREIFASGQIGDKILPQILASH